MKPDNLHGILGHGLPEGAGEGEGTGSKRGNIFNLEIFLLASKSYFKNPFVKINTLQ